MNRDSPESGKGMSKGEFQTQPSEETIGVSTTDWSEARRRLETAQAAIARGWSPTVEETKEILKERAKTLAQEPRENTEAEGHIEVVAFRLADENYAIGSVHVREVYPLKELTPLPCTPPFVLGIINVRGQILSAIDLKRFFDLPATGLTDLSEIIILHTAEMEFGILADAILSVREIPLAEIQPSLPTLRDVRAEYLRGVTNERLVILDGAKLLSDEGIIVHEEVET